MGEKRLFKAVFVDDEIWALRGIQGILDWKEYGYENVGAYTDPREALADIERLRPDVIFTDIRMPEIDGMKLIEQVKELVPSASFVIVSAYRDFEIAKKAFKNEVSDYLIKPLDKNEVKSTVSALYEKLLKKSGTGFRPDLTAHAPLCILTASKDPSALFTCLSPIDIPGFLYSYVIEAPSRIPSAGDFPEGMRIGLSTPFSSSGEYEKKIEEAVKSYRGGFLFSSNDVIAKIEEFLYDNLDQKITMESICGKFFLSKPYIFELFRENSDTTAMGFLKTVRLNRAADLLRSADTGIAGVAAAVGFDDAGYFAKNFKARFGITPEQYASGRK